MSSLRPYRAALLSLVLGVLCLGPALLPGRSLLPADPRGWSPYLDELTSDEAAEVARVNADAVPHRMDRLLQFLPFDTAVGRSWARGEVPLWDDGVLGGLPLLGQATSRAFYPTALVFTCVRPELAYAWLYLLHLVLGGVFLDRLARRLGASEEGALLGAASFVLSGYALGHLHHPMIFFAALWTLPALEAAHALLRPRASAERDGPAERTQPRWRRRLPLAALAASTALSWLAGFPQASVLLAYMVVGLAAALTIEDQVHRRGIPWRALLQVGAGLALGIGLAAVQILPALEASRESSREPAVFASSAARALAPQHLLELLLPGQLAPPGDLTPGGLGVQRPSFLSLWLVSLDKAGPLSQGVFNHMETAFAIGIWPLLFALLTLIDLARGRRGELRVARAVPACLWGFTALGLLVALAVPGLVHAALWLPGFAVGDFKRLLMLPAFCLPLLAALGWRPLAWRHVAAGLVPGALLFALGMLVWTANLEDFTRFFAERIAPRVGLPPEAFLALLLPGEASANQDLLGRGLVALAAALAVVPALLLTAARLGPWPFVLATALELVPVATDLSPAPRSDVLARPPELLADIAHVPHGPRLLRYEPLRAGEPQNFADVRLLPPNLPGVVGLRDAMGYAPLPPARVKRFFDLIEPGATSPGTGLGCFRRGASLESPLLPLFGDLRLLASEPVASATWIPDGEAKAVRRARLADPPGPVRFYRAARTIAAEDLHAALEGGLDPARVALLEPDHRPEFEPNFEPDGELEVEPGTRTAATFDILRSDPGAWELAVTTDGPAVLMLSEAWAPGWKYTVDAGEARDCFPVAVLFRGAVVPTGAHTVRFTYEPAGFALGLRLSAAALLGLLLAWLVPLALLDPRPATRT